MAQQDGGGPFDLLVIGGGVNGCAIARDAAGRGLRVALCEAGDLGQGTSSASTKLFHGGLRYLEYLELRLVREALAEREVLLRMMPHIAWPLRFVLPLHPQMRFEASTPVSRLLGLAMPWARGRRPAWLIRLGLALYDGLGGREILPPTRSLDLRRDAAGQPLQSRFTRAFEYSDCWVDDSRLVVLLARDAAARGARILTRCRVTEARADQGLWTVQAGGQALQARLLVNAAGPWAGQIGHRLGLPAEETVRLVRGSHVVTRRLHDHDRAYFLQGRDGRIVFAIPYEQDFTLIGTTDVDHPDPDTPPVCTPEERAYLLAFVSDYFARPVTEGEIVHSFSGLRALHDPGTGSAAAASRDYALRLETAPGAPVLHVIGGKITTHRRLAEAAMERIAPVLGVRGPSWTARAPLPGGDFPVDGAPALMERLRADHPFLELGQARRLIRAYGTEAWALLGGARRAEDLGRAFGAGLTEAELDWMARREWARTAEDALWRRSKLGLRLSPDQVEAVAAWFAAAGGTGEAGRLPGAVSPPPGS